MIFRHVHLSTYLMNAIKTGSALPLRQESRLNEAFLISDSAGCYHCAFLLLSFPSLGLRVGVRIARYDFSEAQAGKDTCDRRAPALKSHIRRYINEGNDVKTASDMKATIESHGGVKGSTQQCARLTKGSKIWPSTRWVVYSLWTNSFSLKVERSLLGGPTMPGPERSFPRCRWRVSVPLKARQTYKFTRRSVVLTCWLVSSVPHPARGTAACSTSNGTYSRGWDSARRRREWIFGYPEEGCIKVYQSHSSLQRHLDTGKHLLVLERESTYDVIKKKWVTTCK